MHILIINPNSTASMTASIAEAARAVARAGTVITAINPADGPASIQGHADGEAALPHLFALFDEEVIDKGGYDCAIIACFDDTGLWELRKRSPVPVIGIGEAGYLAASLVSSEFSVVTTLSVSVPVLESNLDRYGFRGRCRRVRASGVPVLSIESDPQTSRNRISEEIATAVREDSCGAVSLGCAGMADLAAEMTTLHKIPVIDGVAAAVGFCEALAHTVPYLATREQTASL